MHKFPKLQAALIFLGLTLLSAPGGSAASAKSTDAPGLRSIAFEHYLSGDTDAALDYYQKAIDTASREYGADSSYIGQLYYEMGTLALDSTKFARAESYLQKAVQHNPNSVMARVKFAELLQRRGKPEEALQQINAALAKHSNSPEAREALVIWLQANNKTARAIHESYNVTVAASGNAVAPPAIQTAVAKAETPKPAEAPVVVASAATPATPASPAGKVPLKIFPWMQVEKKPEPKKEEPEKKAPEKKPEKKEEKKPVEKKQEKKQEKKAKKEPKQAKPVKEKHSKSKPADVQVADEGLQASAAALRTTARTIPKKKEKSADAEMAPVAAAPPVMFNIPTVKSSNRPKSMVPPPPPMVPTFINPMAGMFQPPPGVMHAPAQPKVAKKPKAAPAAKEPAAEPKASAASSSGGGEEQDPNFLLDWAGANAKKKGK